MSLAEAAAFLAEQWPVFACRADKKPATAHGFKDATRDIPTVRRMFAQPGAALIGVPTGPASGLFVVDIDVRSGGEPWLVANADRLPRTRTHRTMSGGWHLLFAWPQDRQPRNSASKIAAGVDTRGAGGYVVMPPSDGYAIEDDAMPAEAPAWLLDLIDPPAPPPAAREAYQPPSHERSARYAEKALDEECRALAGMAEGSRNDALNIAAVKLGSLVAAGALSESTVRAELRRAALHAGLDPRETDLTIQSGLSYGLQNPRQIPERPGIAQSPRLSAQTDSHLPFNAQSDTPPRADAPSPPGLPLLFLDEIQPCLEAKDFVEGVLIEQSAAVVYGDSNAGKTFFCTDLALSVAAGQKWFDREVDQGGVVYCVLEGGDGFRNRVRAWMDFNGAPDTIPFAAIPSSINLLDPAADTQRLIDAVQHVSSRFAIPVKLIVIDTLARALAGGNENASEDMGQLVLNMDLIRAKTGAAVLFIHHSGKDQARGARGHSSLRAAVDTEIEVKTTSDEFSAPRSATMVKQRELPKGEAIAFVLKSVALGNNRRGKPVTTCVVLQADPSEVAEAEEAGKATRMSGGAQFGLAALHEALIAYGRTVTRRDIPGQERVVTLEMWRREFYARSHLDSPDAKRQAFNRAVAGLRATKQVIVLNDEAWIPHSGGANGR